MLEYYLFPKMLGLVERAWAVDPEWTSITADSVRFDAQDLDWNQFASRIGHFELPRLSYLNGGVNYRIAPPGVVITDGKLFVNTNFPGVTFRYTTDSSEPTAESAIYTEPVTVAGTEVKVVAFYPSGKASKVSTVTVK